MNKDKALDAVYGRRGKNPASPDDFGTCFREATKYPIVDEGQTQDKAHGFFKSQILPDAFHTPKDGYRNVDIGGAKTPDDYFQECPWDESIPTRKLGERMSDIKYYPRSRHATAFDYDDPYNERLAMEKVVRTKPMSFFVIGPSLTGPTPLAMNLAHKFGAVLIEPRKLVQEYFKKVHTTKTIEYDIEDSGKVISSEATSVPARLLGDLMIKKLKSYAVYKRGYVLTGVQYCKYSTPDSLSQVLHKVFSPRFAPDVVVYVEASVQDLENMYESYAAYPMFPYEMVENFTLMAHEEIDARKASISKDPRDDFWYKIGKDLSFEECLVMDALKFKDIDVYKKKKHPTHYIPEYPELVTCSIRHVYNAIEDMKAYYEAAFAIHRYVNHMDHHFVLKVKSGVPATNQFHNVMTRLNCLAVYKVPQVKYGPDISAPFVDEEMFKESKEFVDRMGNDEVVGVLLSKYAQDVAELDDYDSDQDEFYLSLTTYFDSSKPTAKDEEAEKRGVTIVDPPKQRSPMRPGEEPSEYRDDDMTFEERYVYAQEQATLNDRIKYLRTLNLKEAINSYNYYKKQGENLSDDEFSPDFGSKQVNYRATLSSWGRRCPVAFQHGMMIRGQSRYAARYHDKLYFMSSKKALKKFALDPDRYLFPVFPTTPCNVIVSGHPISGKTLISEAIATYYNAMVVDFTSIRRKGRHYKHMEKLKFLGELTRLESQRYVNAEGVDLYINDEFERHEDFLDWFIVVYRLVYFRALICPPENIMTLPRKHGCVLPKKLKRTLSDIEEMTPSNIFKKFFKYVTFHNADEETQLINRYQYLIHIITLKVHEHPNIVHPIPPGETDEEKIRNARRMFRQYRIPYFGSLSILEKYLSSPVHLLRYCPKLIRPHKNPFELEPYHPLVSAFALDVWKLLNKTSQDITVEEEINLLVQAIYEIEHEAKDDNLVNYGGWVVDGVFVTPQLWQGLWEKGLGNTFIVYLQDADMDYLMTKFKTQRHVNRQQRIRDIAKTLEGLDFKKTPQEKEEEVLQRDCRFDVEEDGIQLPDLGDVVSSESEDEHLFAREYKRTIVKETFRPDVKSATKDGSRNASILSRGDSVSSAELKRKRGTIDSLTSSIDSRDSDFIKMSKLPLRYRASVAIPHKRERIHSRCSTDNLQFKSLDTKTQEMQVLKMNLIKKKFKLMDNAIIPREAFSEFIYNPQDPNYDVPMIEDMYKNMVGKWNQETETYVVQYFHDMRVLMDELRNDTIKAGLIKSDNYYRRYVGRSDPLKYAEDFYDIVDGHGAVHRKKSPLTSTYFTEMEEMEELGFETEGEESTASKSIKTKDAGFEHSANIGTHPDRPIDLQEMWKDKYKISLTPKEAVSEPKSIIRKKLSWCVVHLREGRTVRAFNKFTYLHKEYPVCAKMCMKKFRRWPYLYTAVKEPYSYIDPMKLSVLGLPGSGSNKVAQVLADYLGLKYLNFYDRFNEKALLPGFFPIGPYYEQPKLTSRFRVQASSEQGNKAQHYEYLMNAYLNRKRRMPLKHWIQFYMTDFKNGGFVYHQMPYSIHDFICMYGMDIMPDVIINLRRKRTLCRRRLENKVLEMWKRRTRELNRVRLLMDKETKMYWKALYLLNFWRYLRIIVDFFAELKRLTEQGVEYDDDDSDNRNSLDEPIAQDPVLMSVFGSMKTKKIFYMPHKIHSTKRVKYNVMYIPRNMPVETLKVESSSEDLTSSDSEDRKRSFYRVSDHSQTPHLTDIESELKIELKSVPQLPGVKAKETLAEKLRRKVEEKKPPKSNIVRPTVKPQPLSKEVQLRLEQEEYKPKRKSVFGVSLKRIHGTMFLPSKPRMQSILTLNAEGRRHFRKTLADIQFGRTRNKWLRMLEVDAKCIFKKLKAILRNAMKFDNYHNETKMGAAMLYLADDADPNKVQVIDLEGVGSILDIKGEIERIFIDRTLDRRIIESLTLKGIEAELITKFPILSDLKTGRKFSPNDGEMLLSIVEKYRDISRFAPYVVTYMAKKYPKPMLLGLHESHVDRDEFKETLAKTLKKETVDIKKMRTYSKVFKNAWLDVKPGRRTMKSIMTAMYNYRMPLGENVYEIDFKYAEEYIDNGTWYLSKFGRRCPVECYEKNTLWHSSLSPNEPIVVAHKKYIYFLSSEDAKLKFVENPLKYTSYNLYNISVPVRILILGPENSRRLKVAQYFRDKYLFEIVTVDMAMRFLYRHHPNGALGNLMLDYLRRGLGIPIIIAFQVIDFYISACGNATGYGWVLVGIPALQESLCVLKEMRLIPHLILVVNLPDKEAYFRTIERKKDGKLRNGNVDIKILRFLDKGVAERNFDNWKKEDLVVGCKRFCKQAVSFHVCNTGNYYPLYNAVILEKAMAKMYNALKASHFFRYNSFDVAAPVGTFNRMDKIKFNHVSTDIKDNCILCWEYEGILTKSPNSSVIEDNIFEVNNWCYWLCDWHRNQIYISPPQQSMKDCRKPTALLPIRYYHSIEGKELDFPYCVTCYKNDVDAVSAMNGERYVPSNLNCLFACAGRFLSGCREECMAKFYKKPHRYITAVSNYSEILEKEDFEESFKFNKEEVMPDDLGPSVMKYPDWFVYNTDVKIPKLLSIDELIDVNADSRRSSENFDEYFMETASEASEESQNGTHSSPEEARSPSVEKAPMPIEDKSVVSVESEIAVTQESVSFKYIDDYRELDKFSFESALEYLTHLYNNTEDMTDIEKEQYWAEYRNEIGNYYLTKSQEKILHNTIKELGGDIEESKVSEMCVEESVIYEDKLQTFESDYRDFYSSVSPERTTFQRVEFTESEYFEDGYYLDEESEYIDPYSGLEGWDKSEATNVISEVESEITESEWPSEKGEESEAMSVAKYSSAAEGEAEEPSKIFEPSIQQIDSYFEHIVVEHSTLYGEGSKRYPGEAMGEGGWMSLFKPLFFIEPEESFEEFFPDGGCTYSFTSGRSLESAHIELPERARKVSYDKIQFDKIMPEVKKDLFKVIKYATSQYFAKYMTQTDVDEVNLCPDRVETLKQVKQARNDYNKKQMNKSTMEFLAEILSDFELPLEGEKMVKMDLYKKLMALGDSIKVNVNRHDFPRYVNYDRKTQTFFNTCPASGGSVLAPYFIDTRLSTLCPLCAFSSNMWKTKYDAAITVTPFCCFMEYEVVNNVNEKVDNYNEENVDEDTFSIRMEHFESTSTAYGEESLEEIIYEDQERMDLEQEEEKGEEESDEDQLKMEQLTEETHLSSTSLVDMSEENEDEESTSSTRRLYEPVTFSQKITKGYPSHYSCFDEALEEEYECDPDPPPFGKSNRIPPWQLLPQKDRATLLEIRNKLNICSSESLTFSSDIKASKQAVGTEEAVVDEKTERRVTIQDSMNSVHYFYPDIANDQEIRPPKPDIFFDTGDDDDDDISLKDTSHSDAASRNIWRLLETLEVDRKIYSDDGGRAKTMYKLKNMLEKFMFNRSMLDMIQDPFDVKLSAVRTQFVDGSNDFLDLDIVEQWLQSYHEQSHVLPDAIELLASLKDETSSAYIIEILRNWVKSYAFGSYNLHHFFDVLKATKCRKIEHNMLGYRQTDNPRKNNGIWDLILSLERSKMPLDRIATSAATDALHRNRFLKDNMRCLKKRLLLNTIRSKLNELKAKWTRRTIGHEKALDRKERFLKIAADEGKKVAYKEVYGDMKRKKKPKRMEPKTSDLGRAEFLKVIKKPKKKKETFFEKDLREFLTTVAYDLPPGEPSHELAIQERILDLYMKRRPNFYWMDSTQPTPAPISPFYASGEPDELPHSFSPMY